MRLFLLLFLLAGAEAAKGAAPGPVGAAPPSQLAASSSDTAQVLELNNLCKQLSTRDISQALRYGQRGLELARRLRFVRGELDCLVSLAAAQLLRQDYVRASQYYHEVIRRAGPLPWAQRHAMLSFRGLGRISAQSQDFAQSAQYFRSALAQQRLYAASAADVATGYNQLAMLYGGWLRSKRPAPDSIRHLHEHYARLALAYFRKAPASDQSAACLNILGLVNQLAGRNDSAIFYQQAALRLYRRFGNTLGLMRTHLALASVRVNQQRWAEAATLIPPAVAWARQLHATEEEAYGYHLLAQTKAATGQGLEAYRLAVMEQALIDTLQSTKRREALALLQIQFDTERQRNRVRALIHRNQLQELTTRKQRIYLALLGGLLVAVVGGLLVAGTLARRLRRSQAQLTRQNAEMAATRAEQDRLYALVAHDLRSPVVAFVGLADLMTEYVQRQDTARLVGLGDRVRQAAEGLRALLDNLLSWALAQRGELISAAQPLAVSALLADTVTLYEPSAEARSIQFQTRADADLYVYADLHMTRTILRNLLSNALQATPAGGTISLTAQATSSNAIALQVTDTGHGMIAEQVQQLVNGATRPGPAGTRGPTGLGLRLSWLFAQAQGGGLLLHSVPEQGTTVTLTLPAAAGPPLAPADNQLAPPAHAAIA